MVSGSQPSYHSLISTGFIFLFQSKVRTRNYLHFNEVVAFLVAAECFGENQYRCVNGVRTENGDLFIRFPAFSFRDPLALTPFHLKASIDHSQQTRWDRRSSQSSPDFP